MVPAEQHVPLQAEATARECDLPAAAKESAPVVRPQVEVTAPAHSPAVPVKAIALACVRLEVAKVTDLEYDLPAAARVTDPAYDLPVAAKAIDLEYDRQEAARVTDLEFDLPATAIAPDVHRESATRTDRLPVLLLPSVRQDSGLRDNARQVGDLRAIGHLDGGHRCTVRPLPARLFGTRGIGRDIARRDTGGDRLRQQP